MHKGNIISEPNFWLEGYEIYLIKVIAIGRKEYSQILVDLKQLGDLNTSQRIRNLTCCLGADHLSAGWQSAGWHYLKCGFIKRKN